jgi:hypothetical protein
MELSVEAKKEYLSMLCDVMAPIMTETFIDMYKEAINRSNRHRDQVAKIFTVLLEEVENWNNSIIATHVNEYETKCHFFTDLLAAVFVCYVKILSSIRINREPKKLPIKLPTNADFVHACLIRTSQILKNHIQIFREENQFKKEAELRAICNRSVEETLNKLIPIQQILRTYIADTSAFDLNDENAGGDGDEQPPAEPEFPGEVEQKTEEVPEVAPVPAVPSVPEAPQETEQVKMIGISNPSPNLFDDAAEKISRETVHERAA